MNYRHIFHAGNFADVFKHAIETTLLQRLAEKPNPFVYIDTHAGIGLYDLTCEQAQRSPEYQHGIAKLLSQPQTIPELEPYLTIVKHYYDDNRRHYPGSVMIASHFIRSQDKMIVNEYHPEDFQTLKHQSKKLGNIHYHHRDAYEFLPAILPPTPNRGLVLIDPPFEQEDEFKKINTMLASSIKRFNNGMYMLWYPIVIKKNINTILNLIHSLKLPILNCYLTVGELPAEKRGLVGSGVMIINPPWKIEDTLSRIGNYLLPLFQLDKHAQFHLSVHHRR